MTRSVLGSLMVLLLSVSGSAFAQAAPGQPQPGMQPMQPGTQKPGMQKPGMQKPAAAQSPSSAAAQAARADMKATLGFVPGFINAVPEVALPGAWEQMKTLEMNPNTVLPGKIKELIGLAVAAQVPCKYCTYAHTQFAKLNGASEQEIGEAVMVSALTRQWSTMLQGAQTDYTRWKQDVGYWVDYAKRQMSGQAQPPQPVNVTDAATAMQDIQQTWGSVPEVVKMFPAASLPGAWKEERDVEMGETAIPGKYKSLIGLGVAAQVPCRFCIEADKQFARLQGATDQEISEALAMAAHTRHWSTVLNGLAFDENAFKRDVDKLVKGAKKAMPAKPMDMSQKAAPMPGMAAVKPTQGSPAQSAKPATAPDGKQ
jgi:AhpD family alkylhydroperoxidase